MLIDGPPWVLEYTEPIVPPGAPPDAFVPGCRELTVQANVWGVHGVLGKLKPILGADNAYMKARIAEHVKNILRGRRRWGLKVRLSKAWAEAPPTKLELTPAEAMPRAGTKRARDKARAPPTSGGAAPPAMGSLG